MADASTIGANFSDYIGSPGLGGGTLGVARIDTGPLEDLAKYTMLYNKSLFDQRQKDADEKILELSKLASIHVNDLRGKDRDEIIKQLSDTINYAQEYARQVPKNPKEKIEQNLEWQKKTLDLYNNYNSGKARSVKYMAELNKIEDDKTLSEATKSEKKKELDDYFDKTKISEQIPGVPDYALSSISIPPPATLKANIIQQGANANLDDTITIFNYKANGQQAFNILNGLDTLYIDEKTAKGQTPQARQQRTIESEAKAWRDSAGVLNGIIKDYVIVDAYGKKIFDAARFEEENADNKILMGSYNALKNMDADARAKFSQAQQGKLSDRGFGFNLPPNVVADDFREGFVDFTKEISPEKIITAGMFSKYQGDTADKKVTSTDDAIQRQRLAAEWARIGLEKERIKKASTQSVLGADAVIQEVKDAINQGQPRRFKEAGGKWVDVLDIADPNLLKEFATIDKDGAMINRPDVVRYDKSKNQLSLVYLKKYTEDEDGHKKGDPVEENGATAVDRTVPINPTQWLGQIVSRKFSADDRGEVNNFVDQIYNSFDRDLSKLASGYKGGATTTGAETKTSESVQTSKPTYNIGGKTLTDEQIEKGAKKYKMTKEQYLKSIGQ